MPYQVFGDRPGALALMIAWSRSAMARSGSRIAAIFASTSLSPSALSLFARAAAFSSWLRSFIAARSSSVNPLDFLLIAVVLLADFCVSFFRLIETSSYLGVATTLSARARALHSSVLKQPEDVAIGICDGGHQATG